MICSQVIDTARAAAIVPRTRNYGAPAARRGKGGMRTESGAARLSSPKSSPLLAAANHGSDLTTAQGSEFKRHQRPISMPAHSIPV
jgi:hypothetical protein